MPGEGTYTLTATLGGRHIRGSPMSLTVFRCAMDCCCHVSCSCTWGRWCYFCHLLAEEQCQPVGPYGSSLGTLLRFPCLAATAAKCCQREKYVLGNKVHRALPLTFEKYNCATDIAGQRSDVILSRQLRHRHPAQRHAPCP